MRRRVVLWILLIGLVAFFAYDFLIVERNVAADYDVDRNSPRVAAELLLQNVRYDPSQSGRLLADLIVTVRSVDDIQFSGDAAFAVRRRSGGNTPWLQTATQRCNQIGKGGGLSDPRTAYRSEAQFTCKDAELATDIASNELWYPFDGYSADLRLAGCVNKRNPCDLAGSENGVSVRFTRLRVEPGEKQFITVVDRIDDQALTLSLKRRFFLRSVSVILAAMVLVFVWFLITAADPKEAMLEALGLFGGLWALRSLIVPESVSAFPTLVDYSVLTVFCVAFLALLFQVPTTKR